MTILDLSKLIHKLLMYNVISLSDDSNEFIVKYQTQTDSVRVNTTKHTVNLYFNTN